MNLITENDDIIYITEGVDHEGKVRQFGIPKDQVERIYNRGSNVKLAQLIGIVFPGLVLAEHIFQGLKRPLCDGDDMNGDKSKLAFTWRPIFDYWWNEADKFDSDKLEFRDAPDGKVFVVNISPNKAKDKYPSVDYWIERWYWVRRSNTLLKGPTDWENRYEKRLK